MFYLCMVLSGLLVDYISLCCIDVVSYLCFIVCQYVSLFYVSFFLLFFVSLLVRIVLIVGSSATLSWDCKSRL